MKVRSMVAGVLLSAFMIGPGAGQAVAAAAPIVPISPASGSSIVRATPTQSVVVEFTCPTFETSYETIVDWESYWVSLSSNPTPSLYGTLAPPLVDLAEVRPTGPGTCGAEVAPVLNGFQPGTYYWQAERINCDAPGCTEVGPIWSFHLSDPPPPPPPPAPAPVPPPPPAPQKVSVYTACGLAKSAPRSSRCAKKSKVGAFFESSTATRYTVCVRYPSGKSLCAASQRAEAGQLYVNKITSNEIGRFKVTWRFDGKALVRHYRKTE